MASTARSLEARGVGVSLSATESVERGDLFDEVKDRSQLVKHILIAALGFFHLLLFGLICRLPWAEATQEELVWMFGFVSVVLGGLILWTNVQSVFLKGVFQLRAGVLRWDFVSSLGLSLAYLSAALEVLFYVPSGFTESAFTSDLLVTFSLFFSSALFLAAARLVSFLSESGLVRQSRIDLGSAMGDVSVLGRTPQAAKDGANEKLVHYFEVQQNDIIRVSTDSLIPCDGMILSGSCILEERQFSAQTQIRAKSAGMEVYAGSRVKSGEVTVKVVNAFADSFVTTFFDALSDRVERARELDSLLSKAMTLSCAALLFVAACAGMYWGKSGLDSSEVLLVVCSILFVSVLFAPFALYRHLRPLIIAHLFGQGVLLRDEQIVRRLARAERLFLHFHRGDYARELYPTEFDLIDQRVNRQSLVQALFALLGASDEHEDLSLSRFLAEEFLDDFGRQSQENPARDSLGALLVTDFAVFPGQGTYGQVEGADVTIGNEQFLLDRGVHLEQSEVEPETETASWRYVAIGPEVVAKVKFEDQFATLGTRMVERLQKLGVKVSLSSEEENPERTDQLGKSIGLELASIQSGVSDRELEEKLREAFPAAFYSKSVSSASTYDAADVSFSEFDQIRWNLDECAVTIFGEPTQRIATCIESSRKLHFLQLVSGGLCLSLAVLLLSLSASGYMNPLIVMLSSLGCLLACGLLSHRVVRVDPI